MAHDVAARATGGGAATKIAGTLCVPSALLSAQRIAARRRHTECAYYNQGVFVAPYKEVVD
jgi:hypothetical protein